ncbi:MAG: hypothetical protein H6907_16270 [Hyphomicrobiales bacterium]|nr:hypothetical protein [Hyphomicrobiales bacterium]MCP5373282.1 hypothetical protein [Hyphomicrobiales bacterium]
MIGRHCSFDDLRRLAVAALVVAGAGLPSACAIPEWMLGEYKSSWELGYDNRKDVLDDNFFLNYEKKTPGVDYEYLEGGYTVWAVRRYAPGDDWEEKGSIVTHRRVFDPYGNELTQYSRGDDPRKFAEGTWNYQQIVDRDRGLWNSRRAQRQQSIDSLQVRPPAGVSVPRPSVPSGAPPTITHRGGHRHRGG